MKRYNHIFIAALTACLLVMSSCEEKLNLLPYDALETSIALQTQDDFILITRGSYGRLLSGGYYGGEMLIRPEIISDNLIINQTGRKSNQTYYQLLYNSEGTWSSLLDACYNAIFSANSTIEQIDNLVDGDFKDNIRGEALAIRGLAHFDMTRAFSKALSSGSAGDLGIAYMTEPVQGTQPSRGALGDTYDAIIADLEAAKDLLAEDNGPGRFNKYAAYGLLSRVYLYKGDWANARDRAKYVMDNSPYNVTPRASYEDLWDNVYNGSTLFKLVVDNSDGISLGVPYSQTGPTGTKSEYVPDFGLYNLYESTDVRKDAYFTTSEFEGNTFNHVKKYLQRPGSPANVADSPVLRMDEVVLNYAEAQANLNADGDALLALDMLRGQRYSGFISGGESGAALKDAIKHERRLELAFEGHRMFDLKRWGMAMNRSNNGEFFDGTGTPPPASALNMDASDHRWQLPMPQRELLLNPNMQQNPGY